MDSSVLIVETDNEQPKVSCHSEVQDMSREGVNIKHTQPKRNLNKSHDMKLKPRTNTNISSLNKKQVQGIELRVLGRHIFETSVKL